MPRGWALVRLDAVRQCAGRHGRIAGALTFAARNAPGIKAVGRDRFLAGATLLDIITARGLDRTTGKTVPMRAVLGSGH